MLTALSRVGELDYLDYTSIVEYILLQSTFTIKLDSLGSWVLSTLMHKYFYLRFGLSRW